MPITHLCNVFFEKELDTLTTASLDNLLQAHPLFEQLQFLPLLYRKRNERVVVSQNPSKEYLHFLEKNGFTTDLIDTLDTPAPHHTLELWGASDRAALWAKKHSLKLHLPHLDCVRAIHSKLYAHSSTPPMPFSNLLETPEEALRWARSFDGPKVLKKAFGLAGNGLYRFEEEPSKERLLTLFQKETPLIGEPWVEKLFEFSTQWTIDRSINYLGATLLHSSPTGTYLGTIAGDQNRLFKEQEQVLQEHLDQVEPVLKEIQNAGFFGHLGIDAFVYLWKGKSILRALSEINARKTMGWIALQIQREYYPNQILTLRYLPSKQKGFLPQILCGKTFSKQLFFDSRI